jgi:hypothetical protein
VFWYRARGAAGERLTARMLRPLLWWGLGRWDVFHDFQIPRSRANGDHLSWGPAGFIYIDTKMYAANARITMNASGQLWYGRFPMDKTLKTVRWEADRAAEALGEPVRAVIAVHGAKVPPGGFVVDGVAVISSSELVRYLRDLPRAEGWGRARVRSMRRLVEQRLQPAR